MSNSSDGRRLQSRCRLLHIVGSRLAAHEFGAPTPEFQLETLTTQPNFSEISPENSPEFVYFVEVEIVNV